MSELLDETIDDVEVAAGAETDTSDEVARADEPDDVAAPAPAPASIDWNDPELQARIAQQSQQETLSLLERLGVVSFEQPQAEGPPAPDPLSDTYAQDLERWFEAKSAAQNAPFQEFIQAQQAEHLRTEVSATIESAVAAAKLENPPEPLTIAALADAFMPAAQQQYGDSPQARAAAINHAVGLIAADRKSAAEAAVVTYRKQIGEIQDTPAEPSGGGGAGLSIESKPKSYDDIIAKYADR